MYQAWCAFWSIYFLFLRNNNVKWLSHDKVCQISTVQLCFAIKIVPIIKVIITFIIDTILMATRKSLIRRSWYDTKELRERWLASNSTLTTWINSYRLADLKEKLSFFCLCCSISHLDGFIDMLMSQNPLRITLSAYNYSICCCSWRHASSS